MDSAAEHWQAWQETFAARGLAVTHAQFRETFGQRNDAILARWLGSAQSADFVREVGDAKEARYRELVGRGGLTALPGAASWVERLANQGWRQAVASSAPRANVQVVVQALKLDHHFAALVAAEDVTHGKPAPDVFLAAAERVGATAQRCVVVEDAAVGIEAARQAGMRCVGVGPSNVSAADVVVASLADLQPDSFDRLIRR